MLLSEYAGPPARTHDLSSAKSTLDAIEQCYQFYATDTEVPVLGTPRKNAWMEFISANDELAS